MQHRTFGENWLHIEGGAFRLPPVLRGATIRELAVKGDPRLEHEWFVARDIAGGLLYQGASRDDAVEAVRSDSASRAEIERRRGLVAQLVRRYGILAPGAFGLKVRSDGTPIITDEEDSSSACLLFWSGSNSIVSSPDRVGGEERLGRRVMGGTFTVPASRIDGLATQRWEREIQQRTKIITIAVVQLEPGEVFLFEGDSGREILSWDGTQLHHERRDEGLLGVG